MKQHLYWTTTIVNHSIIPALIELKDMSDVMGRELLEDLSNDLEKWITKLSTKFPLETIENVDWVEND